MQTISSDKHIHGRVPEQGQNAFNTERFAEMRGPVNSQPGWHCRRRSALEASAIPSLPEDGTSEHEGVRGLGSKVCRVNSHLRQELVSVFKSSSLVIQYGPRLCSDVFQPKYPLATDSQQHETCECEGGEG